MFELQSMTYFSNGADLGHATVIMNRDNHVAKFEVIFKVDENDEWHFYYENNICIDDDERVDFENWFILIPRKTQLRS